MTRLMEFKPEGPVETKVAANHAYAYCGEIVIDITSAPQVCQQLMLTREDALALIASMAQALQRL